MEQLVLVRPKPGSKKFKTTEGIKNVYSISRDEGQTYLDESIGTYDKERFPKSRQMFRPEWSYGKRRWMLKGYENNSEDLNKLVAACKFKYKLGHPLQNQFIKECDIFDFNDAFFSHKMLRALAQEGDVVLDKSRPFDQIILAGLLSNPKFQYSTDGNINTTTSNRVKYIIIDKGIEQNKRKTNREKELLVGDLWKNLTDKKKMAIAISLNLIASEDTDRGLIDDILYDYANSKENAKGLAISKQDLFIQMCNMDTAKLNIQFTIGKAKAAGYLKRTKQGWMLFGVNIGKSDQNVEEYFSNPDNQEMLFRLDEQLEK